MVAQLISNAATLPVIAAVDSVGYAKKPAGREIGAIRNRLSGTSAHTETKLINLATAMEQGRTVQGALLRDKQNEDEDTDSRFIKQQLFCIDIDNDGEQQLTSIEDIQSRCKAAGITPAIITESFSSSEKLRKFHVFFITDEPVNDVETARKIIRYLHEVFGGAADKACKDAGRIIFGTSPDKQVYICGGYTPLPVLLDAPTVPEPIPAKQESAPAPQSKAKHINSEYQQAEPDVLLFMINPDELDYKGDESSFIRVTAAYKAAGGSLETWLAWCRQYTLSKKSAAEQERENRRTWAGLNCKKVTPGSLKHFAALHSSAAYAAYIASLSPALDDLRQLKPRKQKQESSGEQAGNNPYNIDGSGKLTETNLRHTLAVLGISVHFNSILHIPEFSGDRLKKYDAAAINSVLPMYIYDILQHYLKGVTVDKISAFLQNIIFSADSISNPILEMINGTQWDGSDKLEELYELMHIDAEDKLSRNLLRKWLMQCVCALHNDITNSFGVDEVLVLVGKQGYGKTRLLEKLSLNRLYFGEGVSVDVRNKDTVIQAVSKWICELGEIGSTLKRDIDMVKAFISQAVDEYRLPYAKNSIKYPRRTCFCGSTNDMQFLIDNTGNRRFLTIKLPDDEIIDVTSERFCKFDELQLWAQIKHLVDEELKLGKTYASAFRLTPEERQELDSRNELHTKPMKGEAEVMDVLAEQETPAPGYVLGEEYTTVANFIKSHSELNKFTAEQVGKVLVKLGYTSVRKKLPKSRSVATVYMLPYRKYIGNSAKYGT